MNNTYREDEGSVVYGPPNRGKGGIKEQIGYIGRYMKRPAISIRRILSYDGKRVTFKYFDKKQKEEVTETIDVMEFKGEVCLKQGKLVITYAKCPKGRKLMEEMIGYETLTQIGR